jgi:cysteine desulfurase
LYFDNNATTKPCASATAAMLAAASDLWHNPSSVHKAGQAARHAVEVSRQQVAALLGARARDCTFVSSGTEGLDLAIRGTLGLGAGPRAAAPLDAARVGSLPVLFTTRVEHAAIRDLAEQVEKEGSARVVWLPLGEAGCVDAQAAREVLLETMRETGAGGGPRVPALLAVQWANNETGVVQPVRALCDAAREVGVTSLVDGTQWVGKLPTVLGAQPQLGLLSQGSWCDMLVCSTHKFHGVKGCGVLWARQGVRLRPTLLGTQELGRRGGTENVPAILAAGAAAQEAHAFVQDAETIAHFASLRDELEQGVVGVLGQIAPHLSVRINKPASAWIDDADVRVPSRLWNTTNIGFATLEAEALLIALSERGLAASAGAACSSGSLEPSPVLLAMGIEPRFAHGSIRLSLSRETSDEDVLAAIDTMTKVVSRVAQSMAR